MRSAQPPESWADLAGAVGSHPSLRAGMKNLSGLGRTSIGPCAPPALGATGPRYLLASTRNPSIYIKEPLPMPILLLPAVGPNLREDGQNNLFLVWLWDAQTWNNGIYVCYISGNNSTRCQDHSQKNTDSRKKQKTKHKIGSKTYSQLSFEKRNLETGEEPDCIVLWELTHTKNGTWSNTESQDVYDPKN
uniref:Uncharacterized protein n=1 Tax=Aegilops tauschii TaxID=37682 RepID=M8CUU0_AEGTA